MIELQGDFWKHEADYDALVCAINWTLKNDGCLVMGRGIAKEFADEMPWLPFVWGWHMKQMTHPQLLLFKEGGQFIIGLPTKYLWRDKSDLELITLQCKRLVTVCNQLAIHRILLPRLGCGNGGLSWEDVHAAIGHILDDRFTVIHK